ncbi:Ktr system potassium uptake protein B [bioreactor metagenome]|uniref:Ktr system potassium uptake protein B n=1 Tax=bioreactor metagenome TaxID=1076179 RepID=A0A644ZS09_9ZZZZ
MIIILMVNVISGWEKLKSQSEFANLLDISQWKLTPYQILVLGFAGLIIFGAVLLTLPASSATGERLKFIDALFTATSAVCVTGLVVVDTGKYFSLFGQLVIIGLIQAGGLGIMTMSTLMALIVRKKIQLRERLIMQEALNQLTMAGVVRLTQYIIKAALLLEFIGGTILAVRWYQDFGSKAIYFGYWHAISAFCNAGFDLFGEFRSLTMYVDDITVNLTVTSLIILGGIGFAVISDVISNRVFSRFALHTKIVLTTTALLIFFGTLIIFLLELHNTATIGNISWQGKILGSYFQAVTTRTAGYNTLNIDVLSNATLFFMIILMFIGASPASTGGGVKTSTASVVATAIWGHVSGKNDAELFGRRISSNNVYKAFSLVFISAALVIFVTMMMSVTENVDFLKLLFEVVSAFGTVGLSTGITPNLTSYGKIWLILTMFTGRVGPVTLALALALRKRKGTIQYPEGKVNIG